MSLELVLHLPVGDGGLSVPDAVEVTAAATASGLAWLRFPDRPDLLDPTLVAARLAPVAGRLGLLVEASTGDHAPYNLARRVASLAREHGGPVALALRAGGVDPLTRRHGGADGGDPGEVWAEHVGLLRTLWRSFPADALLGDAAAARFADPARIVPAAHRGTHYAVAGALNVPVAALPLVFAEETGAGADRVVVDGAGGGPVPALGRFRHVPGADPGAVAGHLRERARREGLAGFELVTDPTPAAAHEVLTGLVPALLPLAVAS